MMLVSVRVAPLVLATSSSIVEPDSRRSFSYDRASPAIRWPELATESRGSDKTVDWITLANNVDDAEAEAEAGGDDAQDNSVRNNFGSSATRSTAYFRSAVNPYVAARGKAHPPFTDSRPAVNPYVAAHGKAHHPFTDSSMVELKSHPHRPNGRLIRLSKLALQKAKDWRERVQRLSTAICAMEVRVSVADLLKEWQEQLSPTDMCFVVKRVGEVNWQRALELFEWYNRQHWYEPHPRMLAGMLSILGRVHQVHLAKELFDRALPNLGNCVQVYNAMMAVHAKQGNLENVQNLLSLMKENGCNPDLITYNTVINARCKAGLMPGMAVQLLKDMKKDHLIPDVVTYNTLLSACAAINNADEAEEVFNNMKIYKCEPDLWTYNAMISLYGRIPGKENIAIEYFELIQRNGLMPDAVTFNSILHAFAKGGRVHDVERIRMHMQQSGCSPDEITYNTMISMYGKLGLHNKALSSYYEMKNEGCHPDAVTFTVLIDALGKAERVDEAEKVFQEMADLHITPTLQGFSAMINAYAKAHKFAEALCSYDCMIESGIIPDNLVFCLILDVLQKIDLPSKGIEMYQNALNRGFTPELHAYRMLLCWLSRKGLVNEVEIVSTDLLQSNYPCTEVCDIFIKANLPDNAAKHLQFSAMQGLSVSEKTVLDVMNAFCTSLRYQEACSFVYGLFGLHPEMEFSMREALIIVLAKFRQVSAAMDELNKVQNCSRPLSLNTFKALMTMFHNAGMMDHVILIASDMLSFCIKLDDSCTNQVNSAYIKLQGQAQEQLLNIPMLKETPKLTLGSYVSLMEAYSKECDWEKVERTFKDLQEAGHRPSLNAWNSLISAYAICGKYVNAKSALAAMIEDGKIPTTSTCDAMLQAVVYSERPKDVSVALLEMRQYGVCPGKDAFMAILDYSAGKGKVHVAKVAFEELKLAGYLPNMKVYKSMIILFAKAKLVKDAEDMIHNMETDGFFPDVDIYNHMITLYSKLGRYRKIAEVFTQMEAAGCCPDICTFNSLIWAYSKCLKIQEALAIINRMENAGFVPDSESYTAIISACGRLNMTEAAEAVFKDALESGCKVNYKLFHAIMKINRNSSQPEQVKQILDKMASLNIAPTLGTFHLLMDSYGGGGEPLQAEVVLNVMQEAGFKPGYLQYVGVIDAYLKNKDHVQAIQKLLMIKEAGFETDYMIWTALVGAASHCEKKSEAIMLLDTLADVGFSLPLRLLTEKRQSFISEFDKVLQALGSCGQDAGVGFTNVVLDLLWAFQMRATAGEVFAIALERSIYPSTVMRVREKDWHADLRRLSAGAALIAVTSWFYQMQSAALQGSPQFPKHVTLVTGCNRSLRNRISVQQTVKVHLWTMGSPFLKSKVRSGLFEAKGYSICHWLKDSPHCMDLRLRNCTVLPEMNSMTMHGGAFMQATLVPGLQQIEERMGDVRPKKFQRLIRMDELKRTQVIVAELESREQMKKKGRLNLKRERKSKFRKRLHKVWK